MSDLRSCRVMTLLVTLMFIAGFAALLANPAHARDGCGWQQCCCMPHAYAPCPQVSPWSGCVYEAHPQVCVPEGWRCPGPPYPAVCGKPCTATCCQACGCWPMWSLSEVQIAVGQGQPQTVRAYKLGDDLLVPVRAVFGGMLGASVDYLGWGRADLTLGGNAVTLQQHCYPGWGIASTPGAQMICCKMYAPLSAVAEELGVTVEEQEAVIRLTP